MANPASKVDVGARQIFLKIDTHFPLFQIKDGFIFLGSGTKLRVFLFYSSANGEDFKNFSLCLVILASGIRDLVIYYGVTMI